MLGDESPNHSASYRAVVKRKRDAVLVHERERRFSFWALTELEVTCTAFVWLNFQPPSTAPAAASKRRAGRLHPAGGDRYGAARDGRSGARRRSPAGGGALQRVQIGGTERAAG